MVAQKDTNYSWKATLGILSLPLQDDRFPSEASSNHGNRDLWPRQRGTGQTGPGFPLRHFCVSAVIIFFQCCKSGSCVNDKRLSIGYKRVYSSHIKIKALKRYKDILQIQIKYNKMHTVIQHCPHDHLFTIHSFIHTYIHSHNTSHHSYITHASPIQHTLHHTMHHPPIHHTASQRIIPCITHSSHCISTHHTNKTLYTTNHTDTCA